MLKINEYVEDDKDLFGYYCNIEQKNYIGDNEFHSYKVIGRLKSNYYADVPVDYNNREPYRHEEMEDIVNVIHRGVCEDKVERYRLKDVQLVEKVGSDNNE